MALTLCVVSNPNLFDARRYFSLSSRLLYHSAVRAKPSGNGVRSRQLRRWLALVGSANHSLKSHPRFGMDPNTGGSAMRKSARAVSATSAMEVFLPVPILNDSP